MSEITPNIPGGPSGALPPKKETGKVQPKKETVRINLPPKPTAAPTIKLPTLPPGGPAGAPGLRPAPVAPASGTPAVAPAGLRPSAAAPVASAAAKAAAPQAPKKPGAAAAPARAASGLDTALAIGTAVVAIAALVSVLLLPELFK